MEIGVSVGKASRPKPRYEVWISDEAMKDREVKIFTTEKEANDYVAAQVMKDFPGARSVYVNGFV